MLNAAKHLLCLIKNRRKQIPRFTWDNMIGGFLSNLLA